MPAPEVEQRRSQAAPWRAGHGGTATLALHGGGGQGFSLSKVLHESFTDGAQLLLLGAMAHGVLLVFEGAAHVQRERLAVALPTDAHGQVPIRLTLTFGAVDAQSGLGARPAHGGALFRAGWH